MKNESYKLLKWVKAFSNLFIFHKPKKINYNNLNAFIINKYTCMI